MKRETKQQRLRRLALTIEAMWVVPTHKLTSEADTRLRLGIEYAAGYERAQRDARPGKREDARKLAKLLADHARLERELRYAIETEQGGAKTLRAQLLAVYQWAQKNGIELPRTPTLLTLRL